MCSGGYLAMLKCCRFIKKIIIKTPNAHFEYVCNIFAMYLKDTPNTLGGVDFAKYALSDIF